MRHSVKSLGGIAVSALTALSVVTASSAALMVAPGVPYTPSDHFRPPLAAPAMNSAVTRASFRVVSNHGALVTPTRRQEEFLAGVGGDSLRLLRASEGIGLYSFRVGGETCFTIQVEPSPILRTVATLNGGCQAAFPEYRSVDDHSVYYAHCPAHSPSLFFVAGVASDGVATVTLLDSESRVVARTRVVKNVYIIGSGSPLLFSRRATQLVARDTAGKITYRSPGAPYVCVPGALSAPSVGGKTDV